ncbi:ribonuclease H [Bradyrhizobium sp. STM 3561]|uniref:ribonuclease H family protein n=1 Tax=Bradyrhizobium sp. STM 3561 TaxID=578923 RepID=UPI00388E98D5
MSGLNWNKRRPIYEPWYARLDRDPFARDASKIIRHGVQPSAAKPAKPARPKQPAKTAIKPFLMATGAFAGKPKLRTSDAVKAREALARVAEARIWCDGGCAPTNPGTVGMGAVILAEGIRVELFGGGWRGTNNAAELAAAILALEALPYGCPATVVADSQYLVNGMLKWRHGWRQRDFKRDGGDIPNADRWRKLDALAQRGSLKWVWQRGHCGEPGNELADRLAALGRGCA